MLLGNARVDKPFRVFFREFRQMGAGSHRRGNGINALILRSQLHQRFTDGLSLGGTAGHRPPPALGIKGPHPVPDTIGVIPAKIAPTPLFGNDMQQHRLLGLLCHPQKGVQLSQVMPIHRPVVGNAHLLKKGAVPQVQPLQVLFYLFYPMHHGVPHHGDAPQGGLGAAFGAAVAAVQSYPLQRIMQRPHIGADAHAVVVQYDDQRLLVVPDVVQRLVGQTVAQRAVPYHRHHRFLTASRLTRHGKAQRR